LAVGDDDDSDFHAPSIARRVPSGASSTSVLRVLGVRVGAKGAGA